MELKLQLSFKLDIGLKFDRKSEVEFKLKIELDRTTIEFPFRFKHELMMKLKHDEKLELKFHLKFELKVTQ